ncbi:MAG: DEAD/DEAH box helicase [Shewanella sp.]
MTGLVLRPYQEQVIDDTRQALRKHNSVLMQGPTGMGKTAITVYMMGRAAAQGKRAYFLVHQNELLSQTSRALWRQQLEHGVIASGKSRSTLPAQVASVQTLVRRMDQYKEPDLLIIDEAHRAAAKTYQTIIERWPNARVIGLTATPQRTDGKPLDVLFDTLVMGPTIRALMDDGYLCDYEIYAPPIGIDVSTVKRKMGDYDSKELEEAVDKTSITGDAVAHYKTHASGKRCVVMCVSIKHAEHVAEQYLAAGVPAGVIEGTMTGPQRENMLADFAAGRMMVICNVQLLVEGVDIPAIEVVQWLRPTQSLVIWMQGNGRGLRPADGKGDLIIFDHVGNCLRHGLPDDDREWSLEGKEKGSKKSAAADEVKIKQCGNCYAVFRPGPQACPHCGAAVAGQQRELEVVDGQLEKVDKDAIRREAKREQGSARTLEDLVALGMRRKMAKADSWAAITHAARQGRKPASYEYDQARAIRKRLEA